MELLRTIPKRMTEIPWNDSIALNEGLFVSSLSNNLITFNMTRMYIEG